MNSQVHDHIHVFNVSRTRYRSKLPDRPRSQTIIAAMSKPKLYWEDFRPGAVTFYGPRRITREEIVAFAAEFDPQPMHLDEAAASTTLLGGLAASGWHICCLTMRIITDGYLLDANSMGAPGVDEVCWLRPLRPGTEIRIRATVLETRPSRSRPERGFVRLLFEVLDEQDAVVTSLTWSQILERREPGGRT